MYNSRSKKNKKNKDVKDELIEKIKEMYSNYGIDISNMSDDEFERIKEQYLKRQDSSIDKDLKRSKKYIPDFCDKII
tara:strand:+ start:41 stop:271 length:231 start_codon:yes stop_codon:yes gene_type:complete